MTAVLMPRLSDATTEATIVAWLVPDGSSVRIGDEVVEIETDKATTAWTAEAEGVLSISVPAGHTVCPGTTIARIGDPDGAKASAPAVTDRATKRKVAAALNGTEAKSGSVGRGAPADEDGSSNGTSPSTATAASSENDTAADASAPAHDAASPASASPAAPTNGTAPADAPEAPSGPALRQPSRIERLVSERMVQSRTEIPEFTASVDIDLAAALRLRGDLKAVGAPGGGGRTPSINDLFVKACGLTLVDHPRLRSAWTDEGVLQHERVDIGVAVATDDGGLVVPVVRDADRIGLAALAASTRELTGRTRKGRITPAEMSGATFSISNLGAMGVSHFTAIIGPGQGAILAIGAAIDRYVPVDGQPTLRPICTVTLSSDHRVIYGAHAASFLERLRTILEHPGALAF